MISYTCIRKKVECIIYLDLETKLFKCHLCDFVAKKDCGLKKHMNSHKTCDQCGETFSGRLAYKELDKHIRLHEKGLKCPHCLKLFKSKSAYLKHFKSENCGKSN